MTTGFPVVIFRCIFRIFFSFFVKCLLNPLFRFKHFRKCPKLLSFKTPVSNLAETVGFEPTYQLPDKRISSAPRYDHFDTSPCIKSSYNRILLNAIRSVNRSDVERFWSDILSEQCRNNLAKCLYYCILFFEPKLDNHISSAPRYDHFDTSPNARYCI